MDQWHLLNNDFLLIQCLYFGLLLKQNFFGEKNYIIYRRCFHRNIKWVLEKEIGPVNCIQSNYSNVLKYKSTCDLYWLLWHFTGICIDYEIAGIVKYLIVSLTFMTVTGHKGILLVGFHCWVWIRSKLYLKSCDFFKKQGNEKTDGEDINVAYVLLIVSHRGGLCTQAQTHISNNTNIPRTNPVFLISALKSKFGLICKQGKKQ